jgi:hypothetical protein
MTISVSLVIVLLYSNAINIPRRVRVPGQVDAGYFAWARRKIALETSAAATLLRHAGACQGR